MGKMTRTRRIRIAADMARMLRELQQASTQASPASQASSIVSRPHILTSAAGSSSRPSCCSNPSEN